MTAAKEEVSRLTADHSKRSEELEFAKIEYDQLASKLSKLSLEKEEEIKRLREAGMKQFERVGELEAQNKQLEVDNKEANVQLHNLGDQLAMLRSDGDSERNKNSEMLDELQSKFDESNQKLSIAEKQVESLKEQLELSENKTASILKDNNDNEQHLKDQLSSLESKHQSLLQEFEIVNTDLKNATVARSEAMLQCENNNISSENKIAEMLKQIDTLKQQATRLQDDLTTAADTKAMVCINLFSILHPIMYYSF